MKYSAIEGLRGWLAWTVVIGHVVVFSGLDRLSKAISIVTDLPGLAVSIFICISGFVITHMLLTRDEPYWPYIIRRAFRIFPAYLAVLPIGIVTGALAAAAVGQLGWVDTPGYEFATEVGQTFASQTAYFWPHLLAHVTLLQGAVPDTLLPFSERAMLAPAWSLSLEWQFYLVAPLWIALLRNRKTAFLGVALAVGGLILFGMVLEPHYRLPSILPGKAMYFLIGILSRFAAPHVSGKIGSPVAVLVGMIGVAAIAPHAGPYALWLVFVAFLFADRTGAGVVDRLFISAGDALFNARAAKIVGARAYAIYIVHWPALEISSFLTVRAGITDQLIGFAFALGSTILITVVVSELVHRFVELPMVSVGARLARSAQTKESATPIDAVPVAPEARDSRLTAN